MSQHVTEQKSFELEIYDVIIFNWDVLNGDSNFKSDKSKYYVEFNRIDFIEFVQKGKIIIIEDQTWHWIPAQPAYDVLLSSQVTVLKRAKQEKEGPPRSDKACVNKWVKDHPLIHNLPKILESIYSHPQDFKWFPPNPPIKLRVLQGLHPTNIYSGAFQSWKSGWLPLLYTDDGKHPIMLVKKDGLGVWIVSTMFLASANISVLIENLIRAKEYRSDIIQYYSHYRARRVVRGLSGIGVLLLWMGIAFALLTHFFNENIPGSNTVGINFLISLVIGPLLLWLASLSFDYLRSSLRLLFFRK